MQSVFAFFRSFFFFLETSDSVDQADLELLTRDLLASASSAGIKGMAIPSRSSSFTFRLGTVYLRLV